MNHLIDNLGGIEAFGIFSKKPFLKTMSRLPLEDEPSQAENSNTHPL